MKKITLFLTALLVTMSVFAEIKVEKLWEASLSNSAKPAWMGANENRDMVQLGDKLYVIAKNEGGIRVIDLKAADMAKAVAEASKLTFTGLDKDVSLGSLAVSEDGQLFGGSFAAATLRIYKIDLTSGAVTKVLEKLPASGIGRFDFFGVCGNFKSGNGYIYAHTSPSGGAGGSNIYRWTATDGVVDAENFLTMTAPYAITASGRILPFDGKNFVAMSRNQVPTIWRIGADETVAADKVATRSFIPEGVATAKPEIASGMAVAKFQGENIIVYNLTDNGGFEIISGFAKNSFYGAKNLHVENYSLGTANSKKTFSAGIATRQISDNEVEIYQCVPNNGIAAYKLTAPAAKPVEVATAEELKANAGKEVIFRNLKVETAGMDLVVAGTNIWIEYAGGQLPYLTDVKGTYADETFTITEVLAVKGFKDFFGLYSYFQNPSLTPEQKTAEYLIESQFGVTFVENGIPSICYLEIPMANINFAAPFRGSETLFVPTAGQAIINSKVVVKNLAADNTLKLDFKSWEIAETPYEITYLEATIADIIADFASYSYAPVSILNVKFDGDMENLADAEGNQLDFVLNGNTETYNGKQVDVKGTVDPINEMINIAEVVEHGAKPEPTELVRYETIEEMAKHPGEEAILVGARFEEGTEPNTYVCGDVAVSSEIQLPLLVSANVRGMINPAGALVVSAIDGFPTVYEMQIAVDAENGEGLPLDFYNVDETILVVEATNDIAYVQYAYEQEIESQITSAKFYSTIALPENLKGQVKRGSHINGLRAKFIVAAIDETYTMTANSKIEVEAATLVEGDFSSEIEYTKVAHFDELYGIDELYEYDGASVLAGGVLVEEAAEGAKTYFYQNEIGNIKLPVILSAGFEVAELLNNSSVNFAGVLDYLHNGEIKFFLFGTQDKYKPYENIAALIADENATEVRLANPVTVTYVKSDDMGGKQIFVQDTTGALVFIVPDAAAADVVPGKSIVGVQGNANVGYSTPQIDASEFEVADIKVEIKGDAEIVPVPVTIEELIAGSELNQYDAQVVKIENVFRDAVIGDDEFNLLTQGDAKIKYNVAEWEELGIETFYNMDVVGIVDNSFMNYDYILTILPLTVTNHNPEGPVVVFNAAELQKNPGKEVTFKNLMVAAQEVTGDLTISGTEIAVTLSEAVKSVPYIADVKGTYTAEGGFVISEVLATKGFKSYADLLVYYNTATEEQKAASYFVADPIRVSYNDQDNGSVYLYCVAGADTMYPIATMTGDGDTPYDVNDILNAVVKVTKFDTVFPELEFISWTCDATSIDINYETTTLAENAKDLSYNHGVPVMIENVKLLKEGKGWTAKYSIAAGADTLLLDANSNADNDLVEKQITVYGLYYYVNNVAKLAVHSMEEYIAPEPEVPMVDKEFTYEYEFVDTQFDAENLVKTLNGIEWTLATDAGYFGFDKNNGRGQQIGSSKKAATSVVFTTSAFEGKIKSVVLNMAGASNIDAKLAVSVNGTAFAPADSVALTTTSADYTFTGEAVEGELKIAVANASKAAVYIKSVKVVYVKQVPATEIDAPVFSVNGGDVFAEFKLALTGIEGADIYYTVDGGEAAKYTDSIAIAKTTTVAAWAIKGELKSDTVSATYTFPTEVADITEFYAKAKEAKSAYFLIKGAVVVTWAGNGNVYVKDAKEVSCIHDYDLAKVAKNGDSYTGIVAKYAEYNGALQLDVKVLPEAVKGDKVLPTVVDLKDVKPAIVNHYVAVKEATILEDVNFDYKDKEGKAKAVNAKIVIASDTLAIRSQFLNIKDAFKKGDKVNVEGIVGVYNNKEQLLITAIEKIPETGVENVELNYTVYANNSNVFVEAEAGAMIEVYTIQGQRVYAAEAVSETTVIEAIDANIVIVRVNNEIHKVVLR